jgi:hypothetical protein
LISAITYIFLLDITPHTEGSRVVMMLLIVISLAVLPSLLADALNTLRKRNGTVYLKSRDPKQKIAHLFTL